MKQFAIVLKSKLNTVDEKVRAASRDLKFGPTTWKLISVWENSLTLARVDFG